MKQVALFIFAAFVAASSAGGAHAQAALPEGATLAPDTTGLHTYAPAGNPGATDFDATDRAAIANLIYAYSFAYDNGEADAWFDLFTPDAEFVVGTPGQPAVAFTGEGFRTFWRARMKAFSSSGNLRRHLMSNILFLFFMLIGYF